MLRWILILILLSLAAVIGVGWAVGRAFGGLAGLVASVAAAYGLMRLSRYVLARFVRKIADAAEQMIAMQQQTFEEDADEMQLAPVGQPETITLEPLSSGAGELARLGADFARAGFARAGDFAIEEMPVELSAFVSTELPAYGVAYLLPGAQPWADLVTRFEGGAALTTSSAAQAGMMNKPANKVTEAMPGASIEQMLARHRALAAELRATRGWIPEMIDATTFPRHFTGAYEEEMRFRKQQGGPTFEEVKRIHDATGAGGDLTEEQLQSATAAMRNAERDRNR